MFPITIQDESFQLLPHRALFRPQNNTLYIADTHWGKDETFRAHHIPLPQGGLDNSLNRLTDALTITSTNRLVILGDLLHTSHSLSPAVIQLVQNWRDKHHYLDISLIEGNHDKKIEHLPSDWNIKIHTSNLNDEGIILSHEPNYDMNDFVFCGHLHPTWTIIGTGKQKINLPCFLQTEKCLIFPAFSYFSGSTVYKNFNIEHVYVTTENKVFKIK